MENDYVNIVLAGGDRRKSLKVKAFLTRDTGRLFQILHFNAHSYTALILRNNAFETHVIIFDLTLLDDVSPQAICIGERFEIIPKRLMDGINFSMINNKIVWEAKEKYASESAEHQPIWLA